MSLSWAFFWELGGVISLGTVPFILLSDKRPSGMLAWLWAVLFFPYLGALAYLFFGSERIYRRHLRRRRNWAQRRNEAERPLWKNLSPHDLELAQQLSRINVFSTSSYEAADVLCDARTFYPALEAAVIGAKSSILVEFYIWRHDLYGQRLLRLLTEAAQRGVVVRIIADEMGSFRLPRGYFRNFRAAGGKFSWFNALQLLRNRWNFSLRNHRKLQIIDGEIAFVGGMNLGHEYMGENPKSGSWRDVQIRLTGHVVRDLCQTFWEDWHFATGEDLRSEMSLPPEPTSGQGLAQVLEDGPDSRRHPILLSIVTLLNTARRRVWFAAGYFFPVEPLISALKLCASRGVEVRILIPAQSQHPYLVKGAAAYYEELLAYGVRLFEYRGGMHHAKVAIMDDAWASIGSANLDVRSLRLNFELNVILHSAFVVAELEKSLEVDFTHAQEVKIETVRARSTGTRLAENLCRLLGPIL